MLKSRILVVGSINADLIMRVKQMPAGGETVLCREQSWQNGGKGGNQAVAAARLGVDTAFCAMVGIDRQGESLRESIANEGIRTDYIFESRENPTGLALILLEESGQNRIIVHAGANMDLTPDLLENVFENHFDALLLQLEIPLESVLFACKRAMEKGMKVVLDAGPAQNIPLEQIQGLDILSPNRSEAQALSGICVDSMENAERACRELMRRSHAKNIVLKLDREGAMLYNDSSCKVFPCFPAEAVDTTAAGDAFIAALTKWYVETGDIEKAITAANAAGALAVTKLGAQPSLPVLTAVEALLRNHSGI